jgi:HEPN domain-containing protein
MNGLEAEKPRRLLNNALAFYEASRRCSAPTKASIPPFKEGVELGAPTVVCVAFSIEQFLKLLLLLEKGEYPDEHALDKLFDLLSTDVKTRIDGNFNDWRGARHYLEEARNAFVEWRYPHEKEFLSASDEELTEIAIALHKTVRELRPDLVSVFEK